MKYKRFTLCAVEFLFNLFELCLLTMYNHLSRARTFPPFRRDLLAIILAIFTGEIFHDNLSVILIILCFFWILFTSFLLDFKSNLACDFDLKKYEKFFKFRILFNYK